MSRWDDGDVPLYTKETFQRCTAKFAAMATDQAATGMSNDDDDDVPLFVGTHKRSWNAQSVLFE
jgi:hypothetical protein